ncbi:MAG: hypothetical protein DWQ06_10890 [Calditrichaeota bacterium]|nr:MAG: hypothetical protein DWQ06_10890 [Calditrichota bacterium]
MNIFFLLIFMIFMSCNDSKTIGESNGADLITQITYRVTSNSTSEIDSLYFFQGNTEIVQSGVFLPYTFSFATRVDSVGITAIKTLQDPNIFIPIEVEILTDNQSFLFINGILDTLTLVDSLQNETHIFRSKASVGQDF